MEKTLVGRLREFLSPKKPVAGGKTVIAANPRRRRVVALPHNEPISRLILGDSDLTSEICELINWSPTAIATLDFLSTDPFQQIGGQTGSWFVSNTKNGKEDGDPTHPEVLRLTEDQRSRLDRKQFVLGGDSLQPVLRDALSFGDGFAEMEISKTQSGEYEISRLVKHHSLLVHPEFKNGRIVSYRIHGNGFRSEPLTVPWWKMLHVSLGGKDSLGKPLFQAQVDAAWKPMKETAEDLRDVVRASGTAPWVHSFGPEATDDYIEDYQSSIEAERESRILTDLYMRYGGKIEKAAGGEKAVESLLQVAKHYQLKMIPPGIPAYLFPGLDADKSAKELSGQPALAYARKIANLQSLLGTQIRWALSINIVLNKGWDFFVENGQFEVVWPKWFITGLESDLMAGASGENKNED